MASLRDLIAAVTGRPRRAEPESPPAVELPSVPTSDDLRRSVDRIEAEIAVAARENRVPDLVASRVRRICATIRDTVPRLDQLGGGTRDAHSLMATVTSYLPEALGTYLRLPRSYADRRPIDRGKTALMVLVDQLDLLAATMDDIFEAACRADAEALVAHGRFLEEKFGHPSGGGELNLGEGPR
ncbi:MAG: hypothetical protein QG622_1148 [Actinomycetota bacterium]|nr:hypothetical protein [Actinomycetota bacterium]